MIQTIFAAISPFLFLSPAEPGPYKVMDGASRKELEAAYASGAKPLIMAADDVDALTNSADVVSAVAFRVLALPNLRHTWRWLDVKVLLDVRYD